MTTPEAFIFKFITNDKCDFIEIGIAEVYVSVNKIILNFVDKNFVFGVPIVCLVWIVKRIFIFSASDIY